MSEHMGVRGLTAVAIVVVTAQIHYGVELGWSILTIQRSCSLSVYHPWEHSLRSKCHEESCLGGYGIEASWALA